MPRISIDGKTYEASPGQTVLEVATENGITIPTLCYHKDLSLVGSCRLCVVDVEGASDQPAACTLPASDGLVVQSETPELIESRRFVLEMLLTNYAEPETETSPDNEFTRWVRHYGARPPQSPPRKYAVDSDPNPFIQVDLNQCILCTRCVRACNEVQGRFVWSVGYRGDDAKIIAGLDTTMLEGRCESCGACAAYCPTGALVDRMPLAEEKSERQVTTTCGYCGVGCGFNLEINQDRIVGVSSIPDAPVNGMSLCVKGRYGYDFVHHPQRLQKPQVRQYLLENSSRSDIGSDRGSWVEVEWETALNLAAERMAVAAAESGPDAVGIMASAKCTNEENYLMQKFARQVVGTHNVDHCARLCHSSTVAGLAMALGSGAMSNSMRDIVEDAASMLIIGSNTTEQHPVFGAMIRQAVLRQGVQLVVADPRQIDITEFAALHLRQKPGTDVALINGLMHLILENGWHDQDYIDERCEGFDEVREVVQNYPPQKVSEITTVPVDDLRRAAEILATNHPMAVIWSMGITQHTTGVMNVLSLANLQMMLGNLGIPGGGVNPLRGQNNVQGACDMGALVNVFPGYQSVTDQQALEKFDQAWALQPPVNRNSGTSNLGLAAEPGLTVCEMVQAAGQGDVRVLYILGEDPVMTEPDSNQVRRNLEKCECLVLQEIFPSETAAYADILLPGASFAEKNGTFTNTERRVQLVRKAIEPQGDSRPDWDITADLAKRVLQQQGRRPSGPQAGWEYANAGEIMDEIAAVTPSYAGVQFGRLERGDQLQWPVKSTTHPGTPILHVGQFTRGKGKFHAVEYLPAKEHPDEQYPLILTTGRVLYHWHGGELTRRAATLTELYPETLVEVSPEDAARLGVASGDSVLVKSRRGEMSAQAVVTRRVAEGVIFGNFHFPGPANVNNLTIHALDPVAKIPEYKVCAVRLEKAGS